MEIEKLVKKNSLIIQIEEDICDDDAQSTGSSYSIQSLTSEEVIFRQKSVESIMLLGEKCQLEKQTIYLAVAYIDKLLEQNLQRSAQKMILLSTTLILMSAKVNEIYPPTLNEILSFVNYQVQAQQVFLMEAYVFQKLSYEVMSLATVYTEFKQITQNIKDFNKNAERKCQKILKKSILNYNLLRYGYKAFALGVVSVFFPNQIRKYQIQISNYANIISDEIIQQDIISHSPQSKI